MARVISTPRILFALHVALGLVVIGAILSASPWTIGSDGMRSLERVDFRWWLLVPIVVTWGTPIAVVLLFRQARAAGIEVVRLREGLTKLLEGRQIPISVDVSAMIPVHIDQPLRIPVEVDTKVPLDEAVDIETEVPISTEIDLDTEVETKVFGLGTIRIPIRAKVPINLVLPVKGRIHVRSAGLPVRLREEAIVHVPVFEVPISTRLETRIDVLENLRVAEERIRKRLAAGNEKG